MIFDAATLAQLRKTQEDHMQDTCVIYRVSGKTKNSRGEYVKAFSEGEETICGVNMSPESTAHGEKYNAAIIGAVVRLPHGVEVQPGDEIEITNRFGKPIIPQRYEVDRYTNVGPSGNRAYLKVKVIQ